MVVDWAVPHERPEAGGRYVDCRTAVSGSRCQDVPSDAQHRDEYSRYQELPLLPLVFLLHRNLVKLPSGRCKLFGAFWCWRRALKDLVNSTLLVGNLVHRGDFGHPPVVPTAGGHDGVRVGLSGGRPIDGVGQGLECG